MQYAELLETIQGHINNSDTQSILRLITPENVDTIFKCSSKPGNTGLAQQLTNHQWFADQYNQLKTDIAAEAVAADVEVYFTPENVLISQFGKDYEAAHEEAEAIATQLGAANPATEAEDIMEERMESEKEASNQQPDQC
jgi:hypothetical protein